MTRSAELGIPNWRIEGEYPCSATSPQTWAWEFLRRNKDYRRYWIDVIEPLRVAKKLWPFNVSLDEDPENDQISLDLYNDLENLFGVYCYRDPFRRDAAAPLFVEKTISAVFRRPYEEVRYTFDLTLPLSTQFAKARSDAEHLKSLHQIRERPAGDTTRLRFDKYASYLRVIDAIDNEEIRRVAALTIFAQTHDPLKAFDNHRQAAVQLRDGGYRNIAAHDAYTQIRRRLV